MASSSNGTPIFRVRQVRSESRPHGLGQRYGNPDPESVLELTDPERIAQLCPAMVMTKAHEELCSLLLAKLPTAKLWNFISGKSYKMRNAKR